MSDPFRYPFLGGEHYEQYQSEEYDSPLNSSLSTAHGGPPSRFDRIGFWYRPDQQTQSDSDRTGGSLHTPTHRLGISPETQASVKHRRTRSGCFTCRQRRVKCDEKRPICDRCRKGGRECEFPQPSSSSKRTKHDEAGSEAETHDQDARSRSLSVVDDEDKDALEDESVSIPSTASDRDLRQRRVSSSQGSSRGQKLRRQPTASRRERQHKPSKPKKLAKESEETTLPSLPARWKHLQLQVQELLGFQQNQLTHYHYFTKYDPTDFLHTQFIEMALNFEPLLMAVLAFAAYHKALRQPNGEFRDFWKHYSRCVVLLRKWLEGNSERDESVLLTVLQLAIFEEYLGDWVNVASHHRAAHSILCTLYNHDNFMSTVTSRFCFDWLARLDVVASLMGGTPTALDRRWLALAHQWHKDDFDNASPTDVAYAIPYFHSSTRLIGYDMAGIFANAMSSPNFKRDVSEISGRLDTLRLEIQALHNSAHALTLSRDDTSESDEDSPVTKKSSPTGELQDKSEGEQQSPDEQKQRMETKRRQQGEEDRQEGEREDKGGEGEEDEDGEEEMFDRRIPLFHDRLWPLNLTWIDWYASAQMLRYQTFLLTQARAKFEAQSATSPISPQGQPMVDPATLMTHSENLPPDLEQLSLIQCQIYEAVERWPSAPLGAILGAHTSLALATVFLHRTPKMILWARRKLATVERMGYIWPPTLRKRMAQLWNDPEIEDWWLPNQEGKLPLLEEIRGVVEERNQAAIQRGEDGSRANLRDIKAVFEKLDLGSPTTTTPTIPTGSGAFDFGLSGQIGHDIGDVDMEIGSDSGGVGSPLDPASSRSYSYGEGAGSGSMSGRGLSPTATSSSKQRASDLRTTE